MSLFERVGLDMGLALVVCVWRSEHGDQRRQFTDLSTPRVQVMASCNCSVFKPLELDRRSIKRRMKESPSLEKRLVRLAENPDLRLSLYRCPECGQLWQSGWEWNLGGQVYLFQVPAIEVTEWQREPFRQPGAMMIYSAIMSDFFARTTFATDDNPCRMEGCQARALRVSVFCRDHHIESLQASGRLPKEPIGRLFPPYTIVLDKL